MTRSRNCFFVLALRALMRNNFASALSAQRTEVAEVCQYDAGADRRPSIDDDNDDDGPILVGSCWAALERRTPFE
ncbi:hypothetical protein M514_04968 [Trichuris suis]|uniref:Secreted protein n=1 Tax=Trichuris suis TaxID=68888 RepID=A0A085NNY8_9BILA|nr:hypothetical protein M513_04968 [Trichuris suis]KFD71184.1 hypothetical protein M514_04968 [Trichuris suis]